LPTWMTNTCATHTTPTTTLCTLHTRASRRENL
jgi:hypothetical protein